MTAAEIVRSNARRKTPPSRFQVVKRVEARHNMHDPVVKILADAHSRRRGWAAFDRRSPDFDSSQGDDDGPVPWHGIRACVS